MCHVWNLWLKWKEHSYRCFRPWVSHTRQGSLDEGFQIALWTSLSPVKEEKVHIWWVTSLRSSRHMHRIIFLKADTLLVLENFDHSKVLTQKLITFSLVQDPYARAQRYKLKNHRNNKFYSIFGLVSFRNNSHSLN